jgi:Flp pilus assembly pilin Flp
MKKLQEMMLKGQILLQQKAHRATYVLKDEKGATLLEYVMVAGIVLVVGGTAFLLAGPPMKARIQEFVTFLSNSNWGA